MKLRTLIELLSKEDWSAEVSIDTRTKEEVSPSKYCSRVKHQEILSISSFMDKRTPVVAINTRG